MSLILPDTYKTPLLDKALEFCWETQRWMTQARFYGWNVERVKLYMESRKQLWRRFPRGIRTDAHYKFMEQLKDELAKPAQQRDSDKPVWVNEQLGIQTER